MKSYSFASVIKRPIPSFLKNHRTNLGWMVVNQDLLRFGLLFEAQHLPNNHKVTARRKNHDDSRPKPEIRTEQDSQCRRNNPQNDTWHQSAQDVVAFRQRHRTGTIGRKVFFHETEINILEVMLGKQTPGQPVKKFMNHNQHHKQSDKP